MIIAITLADPGAVAASQKGVLGDLAARIAPNYTAGQVYEGVADALRQALLDQGIAAQVAVVNDVPQAGEPPSVTRDLLPLAVGAAVGYFLAKE